MSQARALDDDALVVEPEVPEIRRAVHGSRALVARGSAGAGTGHRQILRLQKEGLEISILLTGVG